MKYAAMVGGLLILPWVMAFSAGRLCSQDGRPVQQENRTGEKESEALKAAGVNARDDKGVLFIDGIAGKEIWIKEDQIEIELSNFKCIPYTNQFLNQNLDGVCCFVKVKNQSKKAIDLRMIPRLPFGGAGMITGFNERGGLLSCNYIYSFVNINGFPYGYNPQVKTVYPDCEYRADMVFHAVDLKANKINITVAIPSNGKNKEFYVLLKDLKTISLDKRTDEYFAFVKDTVIKPRPFSPDTFIYELLLNQVRKWSRDCLKEQFDPARK